MTIGIDNLLNEHSDSINALLELLIDKGIVTEGEFMLLRSAISADRDQAHAEIDEMLGDVCDGNKVEVAAALLRQMSDDERSRLLGMFE